MLTSRWQIPVGQLVVVCCLAAAAEGQTSKPTSGNSSPATATGGKPVAAVQAQKPPATPPAIPVGVTPPSDYLIGAGDVLTVVFWRDKDMSGDVVVRPDGKITLPLLNDVQAVGLAPDQLRADLTEAAKKLFEDPTITIVVKEIKSRMVYITGQIAKPGPYPLMGPLTVMQLITVAGGVAEYADGENIGINRRENGKIVRYRFNYKDFLKGKNLPQDIELKPGDTIIVP